MEAKHTAGPWLNNPNWEDDDGEAGAIIREGNPDEIICPEVWGIDMLQRDANARLIASAPDLLVACEMALSFLAQIGYCGGGGAPTSKLAWAIAKAKGELNPC